MADLAFSNREVMVEPVSWELAARAARERLVACLRPNERVSLPGELASDAHPRVAEVRAAIQAAGE